MSVKTCRNYYKLEPSNYLTALGLFGDATLLKTEVDLQFITDLDMLKKIEQRKRGGLCYVG